MKCPGNSLAGWIAAAAIGWASASAATEPTAPAQSRPGTIAAADLQADVAVLRHAYEQLHPGLYRYRSKADIDAAFDALATELSGDRSLAEAYLAVSRFTNKVQCGHTYPNFFNQGDELRAALLESPRVPFEFRWIDRRMVVTRSFAADAALRRGTEVLSIDGVQASAILDALLPYSRADGGNDAKRVSNLEVQGTARYEAFDVYYPLLFPRPAGQPFTLVVRAVPGGAEQTIRVPPMAAAARPVLDSVPRGATNPWEYRQLEPGVGYLRMPTWAMYASKWNWQGWLDELFARIDTEKVHDLVIDLRNNEGGSNVGDRILAHLVAGDVAVESIVRKTRYRKVPDDLRPYLDTWDKSFYDWGTAAVDLGDGFYRLDRYDDDAGGQVLKPVPPRYTGRVWVLIGAANSSATFEFASAIRRLGLGTLVGQPTGGNQRGITGGAFFFMRLPKTGIEVDVPLIGQFPVSSSPLPDAGLEPDVFVRPRIEDVAAGRDAELEATMQRIRAGAR